MHHNERSNGKHSIYGEYQLCFYIFPFITIQFDTHYRFSKNMRTHHAVAWLDADHSPLLIFRLKLVFLKKNIAFKLNIRFFSLI